MFKLFNSRNKAELTFCQKAHTQQAHNKANKQLLLKQGRVQHGNTTRTRTTRPGTQLQKKRGTETSSGHTASFLVGCSHFRQTRWLEWVPPSERNSRP